jgi:hypothetical protein
MQMSAAGRPSVVERALQIAKSGTVENIAMLHQQLALEGYDGSVESLAGRSILSQLTRRIAEARQPK